jgi:protein-S-isoprenylcysteine O-methyltransferase Ste14
LIRNWAIRIPLLATGLSTLFFYRDFIEHFYYHFTGSILNTVIQGQWQLVAVNIAIFISFLIPLSFRRKIDWKEYGLVIAFFISLFLEMYGIPLTIALVSNIIQPQINGPRIVLIVPFLWVNLAFTIPMVYGTVLMIIGTVLLIFGWVTLYRNIKEDRLVTKGIYSISRNPQYLGFILVIAGWLVGWPTLLTVIFAPILIFVYLRLCWKEEAEIAQLPGFENYKKKVHLII